MTDVKTAASRNCDACGIALEPEFVGGEEYDQWDNALHITFDGGYGEFVDAPIVRMYAHDQPALTAVICHDCAHKLCETHPWIARIIEPATSHTHKAGREH